jgi:hypothetical protein
VAAIFDPDTATFDELRPGHSAANRVACEWTAESDPVAQERAGLSLATPAVPQARVSESPSADIAGVVGVAAPPVAAPANATMHAATSAAAATPPDRLECRIPLPRLPGPHGEPARRISHAHDEAKRHEHRATARAS